MAVMKAGRSQDISSPSGSIKGQYVFLILVSVLTAILIMAWLAVSSIDSLGKSALDIDKMAAVDPVVMDEIREAINQTLRAFIFARVVPVGGLIFSVVLIGGMIWMNRIVKPLRQLIVNSRSIKQEGVADFPKDAPGEIGLFISEFVDMVDHLRLRQANLENQVNQQSQIIEKKTAQLLATSHMARETTITSQLEHLIARAVNLIGDRFGYYHVAVFLLDPGGQYAVLRAASSEAGQRMLAMRHRLKVTQSSIVGYVASTGMVRTASDVDSDPIFFRNPFLPETHSEIALPLRVSQHTIGVLDIQSQKAEDFNAEIVLVLQTLADQISVAIDKIHWLQQYQETLAKIDLVQEEEKPGRTSSRLTTRKVDGFVYDFTGARPLISGKEALAENLSLGKQFHIPLTVRGELVATLDLWSEKEELSLQEKNILDEICAHVSQAIESAQLFEGTQIRVKREQVMNQFVTNLSRSLDLDVLLQQAVKEVALMPNVNEVSIVINPITNQDVHAAVNPDGKEFPLE